MNGDGKTDYVVARATATAPTSLSSSSLPRVNLGARSIRERRALEMQQSALETPQGSGIAWYTSINGTNAFSSAQWGDSTTDYLTPADYDGDGKTDIAVWRQGPGGTAAFYILQSATNTLRGDVFGQTFDDPTVVGDYDGDGKADVATQRCPARGEAPGPCYFFYRGSNNNPQGTITYVQWGFGTIDTIFAAPGDFDGDGKYDFCIQQTRAGTTNDGQFVVLRSSDFNFEFINWGFSDDVFVPGDYDGDGKSDFCVNRINANTGNYEFYVLTRAGAISSLTWGKFPDFITPGDYDGDGKTDISIWRGSPNPGQSAFWVFRSSDGGVIAYPWGIDQDVPAAAWNVH